MREGVRSLIPACPHESGGGICVGRTLASGFSRSPEPPLRKKGTEGQGSFQTAEHPGPRIRQVVCRDVQRDSTWRFPGRTCTQMILGSHVSATPPTVCPCDLAGKAPGSVASDGETLLGKLSARPMRRGHVHRRARAVGETHQTRPVCHRRPGREVPGQGLSPDFGRGSRVFLRAPGAVAPRG